MAKAKAYTNGSARRIPIELVTIDKLENILSRSIKVNNCLLRINPHHTGYSYTNIGGIKYATHRIIRTLADGKDPLNRVVDHLCRNKSCIRLSHLEMVTVSENIKRGNSWKHFSEKKFLTHCINGHELNDVNCKTFVRTDGNHGSLRRSCRVCHKLTERKRRASVRQRI